MSVTVLWDMAKFYDSVSWPKLLELSDDLGYPALLLGIGLQVHCAPRVLRTRMGCLSTGTTVTTSILAGDGQSNSFARAMLHRLLEKAHMDFKPVIINEFVDDLAQRAEGTERDLARIVPRRRIGLGRGPHGPEAQCFDQQDRRHRHH